MTTEADRRWFEQTLTVTKLKLLEIGPLLPFLHDVPRLDVVEVGGNTGMWCEAFWDVFGPRISSYRAFEPMPANLDVFRRRLRDYLPQAHVELVEACVGATPGRVTLHYDNEVTTLASILVKELTRPDGQVIVSNSLSREVDMVRLDDVLTDRVDLIKIDTEGHEWDVLQGATRVIDQGLVDNVYFEFGAHQRVVGQTFQQFFEFFASRGWRLFRQTVSRNYFGLNEMRRYAPRFEDQMADTMFMILASRPGPSATYSGPRVTGSIN